MNVLDKCVLFLVQGSVISFHHSMSHQLKGVLLPEIYIIGQLLYWAETLTGLSAHCYWVFNTS